MKLRLAQLHIRKDKNVHSNKPFQEADRTDLTKERTIPKGTTFYRTSVNPKGDSSGDRYMTYLEVDRNLYKGGAIKFQANGKDTYETTYTLNKDLKIPSRERQMAAIEKYCKNNRKKLTILLLKWSLKIDRFMTLIPEKITTNG